MFVPTQTSCQNLILVQFPKNFFKLVWNQPNEAPQEESIQQIPLHHIEELLELHGLD